jgi:hypothetical protein
MRSTTARALDVLEPLALLALPAALVGGLAFLVGGDDALPFGVLAGGVLGGVLASLRRTYRAVLTEGGVERERRPVHTDARNPWVRAANVEYDPRYDRPFALGATLLSVAVLGYAAFVAESPDPRLFVLALAGLVVAALVYGAPE